MRNLAVNRDRPMRFPANAMLRTILRYLGILRAPNVGADAEELAARWLREQRGFKIVARNWRNPKNRREEIDIVGRDVQVLVFVEVKARSADALVPGFYAIGLRKKRALRRACRSYLRGMTNPPLVIRFDVVEVILPVDAFAEGAEILYFENVPLFDRDF
jgi:putative endonuclease